MKPSLLRPALLTAPAPLCLTLPMAQTTIVQLTDDLDGKPITDGDGETVAFTYRGQSYELDLSNKNLEALDKALEKYIAAARKVTSAARPAGRGASRSSAANDVDPKAVRAWAEQNGVEVSPRGRIKAEIVERFRTAGQ